MRDTAPQTIDYYKGRYTAASKGNYDIYVLFVERGLHLLTKTGHLGFILPHKFFNAQYGLSLRQLLSEGHHLAHIVNFTDKQVFSGATTYTCLMFLTKSTSKSVDYVRVDDLDAWRTVNDAQRANVPADRFTSAEWNISISPGADLFDRLATLPAKLGDIAHLFVGLQTDADDVFILEEVAKEGGRILCRSRATGSDHWFEDEHLKPFLKGSLNISRYHLRNVTKRLLFPYSLSHGKSVLIECREYKERYPLSWSYLEQNRQRLAARNRGQMGGDWYGYVYKKNHTRFNLPKLLVPSLATGSCFAADLEGQYYFVGSGGGGGGGYGIVPLIDVHLLYLLGLLNSRLLSGYLRRISTTFRGGYIALNRQYIAQLPIALGATSSVPDRARHEHMVSLVQRMLDFQQRLQTTRTPHDKTSIQRQIDTTDNQIDKLVYDLYGLTKEEINIVESSCK